jgi:hypothetical protein
VGEQWWVHCTINLEAGVLTHEWLHFTWRIKQIGD